MNDLSPRSPPKGAGERAEDLKMDIIAQARELAKEIQKDERYLALQLAQQQNDEDKELGAAIGKFNLVRMNLNAEMSKSEKDKARIDQLNAEMRTLYTEIMKNPHMLAFSAAKDEVDKLANQITNILMMAINGEDPDEIDVSAAGCGGNCSSCSGCGQ